MANRNTGSIPLLCEHCSQVFYVYPYQVGKQRFCSVKCRNAVPETTARFKHGKSYRMIRVDGKRKYESRQVAKAPEGLIVHHKDKNTHNNQSSNLEIMSRADHQRLHKPRLGTGRGNR